MSKMFADVQPAVRKETKKVAIGTFVCVVLMWAVFGIGHLAVPEQIPFDYTVLLALWFTLITLRFLLLLLRLYWKK